MNIHKVLNIESKLGILAILYLTIHINKRASKEMTHSPDTANQNQNA